MERVHASCISLDGHGVLLRGPPGSGKSDLALRLMSAGAALVADDWTELVVRDGRVVAHSPPAIAGMLEVRGIGVVKLDYIAEAMIGLVVDLVAREQVERMPDREICMVGGLPVPRLALWPFEASAAAKVRVAVRVAAGSLAICE